MSNFSLTCFKIIFQVTFILDTRYMLYLLRFCSLCRHTPLKCLKSQDYPLEVWLFKPTTISPIGEVVKKCGKHSAMLHLLHKPRQSGVNKIIKVLK